jgi:hypothetical protein
MRNKDVEIKASWSRVRKEGLNATRIKIDSKKNRYVDVDPFGPPMLNAYSEQRSKLALLPPSDRQKKPSSNFDFDDDDDDFESENLSDFID